MHIISLTSQNVKNLKAVRIDPAGNLVVITGKNGAGKSSILDSITMALCGNRHLPTEPIRQGQERAEIDLDMGDFTVKKTITKKGATLKVESKDGLAQKSPQAFLDKIVGKIAFDPMQFINTEPKKQKAILMELIGANTEDLDSKIAAAYEQRTYVGRERDKQKALCQGLLFTPGMPEREQSSKELFEELEEARESNNEIEVLKEEMAAQEQEMLDTEEQIQKAEAEIREATKRIEALKDQQNDAREALNLGNSKLKVLVPADTKELDAKIRNIDEINRKVRTNIESKAARAALGDKQREYDLKTNAIKKLEGEKTGILQKAKFPIECLSFGADCVMYNNIPLDQTSAGEKIHVGVAVSMALNPTLRVFRITDGSLIDEKNMRIIEGLAKDKNYQIWIEKVDGTGKVGFYIEDGELK